MVISKLVNTAVLNIAFNASMRGLRDFDVCVISNRSDIMPPNITYGEVIVIGDSGVLEGNVYVAILRWREPNPDYESGNPDTSEIITRQNIWLEYKTGTPQWDLNNETIEVKHTVGMRVRVARPELIFPMTGVDDFQEAAL